MDMKKVLLMVVFVLALSVGAVSAGLFDGFFGEGQQDNVVEVENITFNVTNLTKFELYNVTEDEDGYGKLYRDENNAGYGVGVYNYSYVDDYAWNNIIKYYKDRQLGNSSSKTVDGVSVYAVAANGGGSGYVSYVQNDDLKILVEMSSPDLNETVKMASTLKFK